MIEKILKIGFIGFCLLFLVSSEDKETNNYKIYGNYYTCIPSEFFGIVYTEHYFHDDSTVVSMNIIHGPEIKSYKVVGDSMFFYTDYWQSKPYEISIVGQDSIVIRNEIEVITYYRLNECVDYIIDYETNGWLELQEPFLDRLNKYCQNQSY